MVDDLATISEQVEQIRIQPGGIDGSFVQCPMRHRCLRSAPALPEIELLGHLHALKRVAHDGNEHVQ